MPFAIMFFDADPGVKERKKALRPRHLEYIIQNSHRIIASGGLYPENEDFPYGGLVILDTDDRQDAVTFVENDPFFLEGIFSSYVLHRWRKAIFDHTRISI